MTKFGETLRREREARRISLREIAETTKIKIRYLEAIEEDRFQALPGGVFNRGFIRAYASYLGLDADAVVRDYLEAAAAAGAAAVEGRLPRADQIESPLDRAAASRLRISMEPDPEPAERESRAPTGWEAARAGRGRRLLVIIAAAVVGVAALAAAVILLRARPGPAPRGAEPPAAADRAATQLEDDAEGFEPPEGMFVDAGPAATAEEGKAGTPPATTPSARPAAEAAPSGAHPPRGEAGAARPANHGPGSGEAIAGIGNAGPPAPQAKSEAPLSPPVPAPKPVAEKPAGPVPGEAASESPAPGGTDRPGPGPMALRVEVNRETWLWVACDSRTVVDRRVRPGDVAEMDCLSSIRVSAHDAGAVRLWVNGAPCMPLGDDGSRVYGYTIRYDDAHLICRPGRQG